MRVSRVGLALIVAVAVGSLSLAAQEGHPLKGSWLGTWSGNKTHGEDVVVVLNWDGKTISGTINPGMDNMPIKNATLNPDNWTVHLEADGKDKSGAVVTYIIDGKIEDISIPKRSIIGTWKSQKESGAFKITRQ
jgi:hypothetical protein